MTFTLTWNPPKITKTQGEIRYRAGHSALVHEGGATVGGTVYPARPFVDAAEQETDFELLMLDAYAEQESIDYAFEQTVYGFAENCQEMILDERWSWPNPTVRSDGTVVGSPRDIFDRGELYHSQEVEVRNGDR